MAGKVVLCLRHWSGPFSGGKEVGGCSLTGSAGPGLRVICYGKVRITHELMERGERAGDWFTGWKGWHSVGESRWCPW